MDGGSCDHQGCDGPFNTIDDIPVSRLGVQTVQCNCVRCWHGQRCENLIVVTKLGDVEEGLCRECDRHVGAACCCLCGKEDITALVGEDETAGIPGQGSKGTELKMMCKSGLERLAEVIESEDKRVRL